jgi:lipoprotein-anchoring transpeptidase ErfK/SrfK
MLFSKIAHYLKSYPIVPGAAVLVLVVMGMFMLGKHHASAKEGGYHAAVHLQKVSKMEAPSQTAIAPQKTVATASTAAANSCVSNKQGKLLLVSISQQHIWACDAGSLVKESAVTTGASALTNVDDATPTGTWHIYSKQTNTTLKGCDVNGCWNDPVAYWMPFDDQVGFHDASWQTFPFGSAQYKTDGSHGCVHLPADFIAWVYTWAPVGTTVTVKA